MILINMFYHESVKIALVRAKKLTPNITSARPSSGTRKTNEINDHIELIGKLKIAKNINQL